MDSLDEILDHKEDTRQVRAFESDKDLIDQLARKLTTIAQGRYVGEARAIRWLITTLEKYIGEELENYEL